MENIRMTCDHCGNEIHFGDDFYYKYCPDGMKHFCSKDCFDSDDTDPTSYVYEGYASLTVQN